jgi:predicted component of type VI protein secretion system
VALTAAPKVERITHTMRESEGKAEIPVKARLENVTLIASTARDVVVLFSLLASCAPLAMPQGSQT